MADEHDPEATGRAPLLLDPLAPVEDVPVLVDAVVETAAPVLEEPTPQVGPVPAAAVAALRDTVTAAAAELARKCLDEVVEEARATLERRLADRLQDELGALVEDALRDHLATRD
jgi:hypothetical protein